MKDAEYAELIAKWKLGSEEDIQKIDSKDGTSVNQTEDKEHCQNEFEQDKVKVWDCVSSEVDKFFEILNAGPDGRKDFHQRKYCNWLTDTTEVCIEGLDDRCYNALSKFLIMDYILFEYLDEEKLQKWKLKPKWDHDKCPVAKDHKEGMQNKEYWEIFKKTWNTTLGGKDLREYETTDIGVASSSSHLRVTIIATIICRFFNVAAFMK